MARGTKMSTVSVNYNFRQFRVKVTPAMVLNDVLSQSLEHFKLPHENESGGSRWGLRYNGKLVELDLPWKLMNLPTGAKLELEPLIDDGGDKVIKVRIQAPGYSSKVESVNINANLKDWLQQLSQSANWPIQEPGVKLQLFNKTIPISELHDQTLKSLGVVESLSLRLMLPAQSSSTAGSSASRATPTEEPPARSQKDTPREQESKETQQLHQVSAYIPSEKTVASQLNVQQEDNDPELTVAHARMYRQMVLRQTGGLGGPMVPRRVKEQQEAAAATKRKSVQQCVVRVRFPDRTHIEVAFKNDDTMSTIHQIVSNSLLDEQLQFRLYQSHPLVELPPSNQKLIEDLQFGSKTLLLFESNGKGPFLKNSILNNAKDMADAQDVKLERSTEPESDEHAEQQEIEKSIQRETKKSTPGKYPKWLKLSKK